jgi:hypothetical protein
MLRQPGEEYENEYKNKCDVYPELDSKNLAHFKRPAHSQSLLPRLYSKFLVSIALIHMTPGEDFTQ